MSVEGPTRIVQVLGMSVKPSKLVKLKKESLCPNTPSSVLKISPTHPMLIDGVETTGAQLVGQPGIKEIRNKKGIQVFTLVTERRTFVLMQNVPVGTWSEAAFSNFIEHSGFGQLCRFESLS